MFSTLKTFAESTAEKIGRPGHRSVKGRMAYNLKAAGKNPALAIKNINKTKVLQGDIATRVYLSPILVSAESTFCEPR